MAQRLQCRLAESNAEWQSLWNRVAESTVQFVRDSESTLQSCIVWAEWQSLGRGVLESGQSGRVAEWQSLKCRVAEFEV